MGALPEVVCMRDRGWEESCAVYEPNWILLHSTLKGDCSKSFKPKLFMVVVVHLFLQSECKHKMHQYNMQRFPERE